MMLYKNVSVTVLMTAAVLSCVSGVSAQMPPQMKASVRVETVKMLDASQPKPYNGSIVTKEAVNLVPRVSGYLTNVAFQEGAVVKKGDLLFEIEDTIYQINVRTAESALRQNEAELDLAEKTHKRVANIQEKSKLAVTEQEIDEADRAVQFYKAKVEETKARLDQAKTDLSYTKIYSPLTGQIGAKQFSVGDYLTPGSGVLATIVQFDPIRITFPISEKEYMTYFRVGKDGKKDKEANIEILLADGKPYSGKYDVDFLDNKIDSQTGTMMIYLLCENPDKQLVPGGWTKVKLSERYADPKPSVSVSALMTDGKNHSVYVVTADNKAESRKVMIGEQVFDRQIIESGLKEGEQVIIGGLNKIKSGDEVIPVGDEKPAGEVKPAESKESPKTPVRQEPPKDSK
jgi:RND family efflux transporter MFP subunit